MTKRSPTQSKAGLPTHWRRRLHDPYLLATLALATLYIVIFTRLAWDMHTGMRTHRSDLGQIDQAIWNSSRGRLLAQTDNGFEATRLTDHVEPILALISPIYWVWDDVRAILLLQVAAAAVGVLPLYLLTLRRCEALLSLQERRQVWRFEPVQRLAQPLAFAVSTAYLLAPQLQSALLTEFHAAPLAVPLILWAFWAVDARRWRQFIAAALLIAAVKEEMALLAAGLGVWAIWRSWWAGRGGEGEKVSISNLQSPISHALNLPFSPSPLLHLLVRTPEQLDAALAARPASITLDYLELYGLRSSVERVQAAGIEVRVASPRVLKPNEQRIVNFLLRLGCPILVRSAGLLHALHEAPAAPPLIGDFSLNAANELTARTFLALGLDRITPTHDLNAAQVADLARRIGPAALEVIAYQHLPVFHTEHCVFCRFLSTGTSYKDCGHPCEKHKVALRDSAGRQHPVIADVGCRNTVFGAEAQDASSHLNAWQAAGIRHYRLEFVHESGEQVRQITAAFGATLDGKRTAADLKKQLQRIAPQGVTEGSLFVPPNYMEIPLLV